MPAHALFRYVQLRTIYRDYGWSCADGSIRVRATVACADGEVRTIVDTRVCAAVASVNAVHFVFQMSLQ